MALINEAILQSRPFELVVGPDPKSFWVHSQLLAQQSPYFHTLVYGAMREAKERRASLDDTSATTLRCFVEYAYTGDYTTEEPKVVLKDSEVAEAEAISHSDTEGARDCATSSEHPDSPVAEPDLHASLAEPAVARQRCPGELQKSWKERMMMSSGSPRGYFASESKLSRLWDGFCNNCLVEDFKTERWHPRQNEDSSESYENVFLCHAELYVFGDRYRIANLQFLALHKLWETLKTFHIYSERKTDFVQLVNYVYANTVDLEGGLDDMRHVLALYMACKVEHFIGETDFDSLLAGTAFAKDLLTLILERLD